MYTRFGPYDKIIHFISGMLLAGCGMMMISRLLKRAFPDEEGLSASSDEGKRKALKISRMIFAFFFSSACAGIWEIFEFTSDKLLGGGMQRGMEVVSYTHLAASFPTSPTGPCFTRDRRLRASTR